MQKNIEGDRKDRPLQVGTVGATLVVALHGLER
jgi:hypothetical protein